MRNLSFVTWMLGWPIFDAETEYFRYFRHSDGELVISMLMIVIWIYVGMKLYVPAKVKK